MDNVAIAVEKVGVPLQGEGQNIGEGWEVGTMVVCKASWLRIGRGGHRRAIRTDNMGPVLGL